jgi:hypothetical protein
MAVSTARSASRSETHPRYGGQQPVFGVHAPHPVAHPLQHLVGAVTTRSTLDQRLQIGAGDDGGDLQNGVGGRIQPGHLEVDPDQAQVPGAHRRGQESNP